MQTRKYFDLDVEFKDFEEFIITKENVKSNKGKDLIFVDKRSIDIYRGYYSLDYANNIDSTHYSKLIYDGGNDSVDIRDIVACVILKEKVKDDRREDI